MAKVRKIKDGKAEVSFEPAPEKWSDPVESPGGSTTYTANADGATVTVSFKDDRPQQVHVLKAGATVKESASGSVHINGDTHP